MGNPYAGLVPMFLFLLAIFPLGVWKLVEIVIWLCRHVHLGLS